MSPPKIQSPIKNAICAFTMIEVIVSLAIMATALLAIFTAGAYGFTMSSNYNARTKPPEVLVDGSDFKVIGRRETYEDLIALEK